MSDAKRSNMVFLFLLGLGLALPFFVSEMTMSLFGKYICFATVALAIDVSWGYTGILSLGQGFFFALGAYCMGMHLLSVMGGQGVYGNALPDFMVFLDWKELPWFWHGFDQPWYALAMIILLPSASAFLFGYLAFRSRVKGVYFSIITQALTWLMMILFFQNDLGLGGNNGLTDFKTLLGLPLHDPSTKRMLYFASLLTLAGSYFLCQFLLQGRVGKILIAIRDAENRARFCGYQVTTYKTFAFTLSAFLCGIAGALYAPQVGIINPSEMAPAQSIEMLVWVAVGGRKSLVGPVLGALFVNSLKSYFTNVAPDLWLFFLGGLFVLGTLYLPQGLYGLLQQSLQRLPLKFPETPQKQPVLEKTL